MLRRLLLVTVLLGFSGLGCGLREQAFVPDGGSATGKGGATGSGGTGGGGHDAAVCTSGTACTPTPNLTSTPPSTWRRHTASPTTPNTNSRTPSPNSPPH